MTRRNEEKSAQTLGGSRADPHGGADTSPHKIRAPVHSPLLPAPTNEIPEQMLELMAQFTAAALGASISQSSAIAEHITKMQDDMQALASKLDTLLEAPTSSNHEGSDGAALRQARKAAGWTQAELAVGLGLSRNTVISFEQGKYEIPAQRKQEITELFERYEQQPPEWR